MSCLAAGALAGLEPKGAQYVAWAKYGGFEDYAGILAIYLMVEASSWPDAKWVAGRNFLRATAEAAVAEWLSPPRCGHCGGSGLRHVMEAGALVERNCQRCFGLGTTFLSGRARAESVGVHHSTWARRFVDLHRGMMAILGLWDGIMTAHVDARMRG